MSSSTGPQCAGSAFRRVKSFFFRCLSRLRNMAFKEQERGISALGATCSVVLPPREQKKRQFRICHWTCWRCWGTNEDCPFQGSHACTSKHIFCTRCGVPWPEEVQGHYVESNGLIICPSDAMWKRGWPGPCEYVSVELHSWPVAWRVAQNLDCLHP